MSIQFGSTVKSSKDFKFKIQQLHSNINNTCENPKKKPKKAGVREKKKNIKTPPISLRF